MNRESIIQQFREHPQVTVLIVGAGINGAGLYRELSLQGIDTLLIDRGDYCSGASAAPSRMIHGGLRYLENGEFRLVRESLKERNLLLQNAPHYVKPLPTTIPIFSWFSGIIPSMLKFFRIRSTPSSRGALLVKAGLTFYDLFTITNHITPWHTFASRGTSLARYPRLHPDIVCTATYYDAWIPYPERLCLELVLDSEAISAGGNALSYVSLAGRDGADVILRDELSGEDVRVRPQVVVNAAGPWIDRVNALLERPTAFIYGTKGSHLVLDHQELHDELNGHMIFHENDDGRICLIFPLLGRVLAGSTDIYVEDPDKAVCDDDEIDYILESVRQVFPDMQVTREHIVFDFCGVRPLPMPDNAGSEVVTGQISRDHSCRRIGPAGDMPFPVYSLIGGKWTTFRAFAEQVTDTILDYVGTARTTDSDHMPIGGGKDFPGTPDETLAWLDRVGKATGVAAERLPVLLKRYGTRAEEVAAFIAAGEDSALANHPAYSAREIEWMVREERVCHLDDLLLRRTTIALQGELTRPLFDELAVLVGDVLGWEEAALKAESERTLKILARHHDVYLQAS
jgi:glycerol-3-phosphate dehydrogenase